MTHLTPLQERASRADEVYSVVRKAIISGELRAGEQVSENTIATQLGTSKTPVREALAMLRARGLLEATGVRGLVVRRVDDSMIRDLYELRSLLEPAAILRAVPNIGPAIVAQANALLEEAGDSGNRHDFASLSQLNRDFHELLCRQCGNELITNVLRQMRDQLQLVAAHFWQTIPSWELERAEHEAILRAVSQGDADAAAERTRDHIMSASARLRAPDSE